MSADHSVEGLLGDRERAGELEVVLGAADPHGRRHERVEMLATTCAR